MKKMSVVTLLFLCGLYLMPARALAVGPQFFEFGHESYLSASPVDCLNVKIDCTLILRGDVHGPTINGAINTVMIVYNGSTRTPNGSGGWCAHFKGIATIKAFTNPSTVELFQEGTVCADDAAPKASHTFSGAYAITGGRGPFNGDTGVGALSIREKSGDFQVTYDGSIVPGPAAR